MKSRHEQTTDEMQEWAALYALETLTPVERAEFEQHFSRVCAPCESTVRLFESVAGELGLAVEPVVPPVHLRQALLDSINEESPGKNTIELRTGTGTDGGSVLFNDAGLLLTRSTAMSWQASALPGVWTKPLFIDRARKYSTSVVRMDPGSVYPSHRHHDIEELYLLEGDLRVKGHVMQPGDYCRAEPGSIHGQVSTRSGALFVALASNQDELLG